MTDDLLARVLRLEDEGAIRRLVYSYGFTADLGDGDRFGRLFTPEAVINITFGEFLEVKSEPIIYRGREEIRLFVTGPVNTSLVGTSQHHTAGHLLVSIDGDNAVAHGYSFVINKAPTGLIIKSCTCRRWEFARDTASWLISRIDIMPLGSERAPELFADLPFME